MRTHGLNMKLLGSSDVYCDKDATIEEKRYPLLYE